PEPAAGLRRVDALGIDRRSFEVIDFPTREVRAADLPCAALTIRSQNESAFLRADKYAHATHVKLLANELFLDAGWRGWRSALLTEQWHGGAVARSWQQTPCTEDPRVAGRKSLLVIRLFQRRDVDLGHLHHGLH